MFHTDDSKQKFSYHCFIFLTTKQIKIFVKCKIMQPNPHFCYFVSSCGIYFFCLASSLWISSKTSYHAFMFLLGHKQFLRWFSLRYVQEAAWMLLPFCFLSVYLLSVLPHPSLKSCLAGSAKVTAPSPPCSHEPTWAENFSLNLETCIKKH